MPDPASAPATHIQDNRHEHQHGAGQALREHPPAAQAVDMRPAAMRQNSASKHRHQAPGGLDDVAYSPSTMLTLEITPDMGALTSAFSNIDAAFE